VERKNPRGFLAFRAVPAPVRHEGGHGAHRRKASGRRYERGPAGLSPGAVRAASAAGVSQ
jgi:hypothetical protein